jgi:hypothetical protein
MKVGSTVRFDCHECLMTFEIYLAPSVEWPENTECDPIEEIEGPSSCPFCGSEKELHNVAVVIPALGEGSVLAMCGRFSAIRSAGAIPSLGITASFCTCGRYPALRPESRSRTARTPQQRHQ